MANEVFDVNRRREIIDICLKKLISKGLYETTSRDLTDALDMSPSSLYYHFKSKDDVVLECAEEAAIRLEETLLLPALEMMDASDSITEQSEDSAQEMRAMIQFLAQVCTANKYREQMQPVLQRMGERECAYCEKFAKRLGCTPEELAPWFFAAVASTESYMIFGRLAYSASPQDFMKSAMSFFKEKYVAKAADGAVVRE